MKDYRPSLPHALAILAYRWRGMPYLLALIVVSCFATAWRPVQHPTQPGTLAASITPKTDLTGGASGITFTGDAYSITCSLSGSVTMAPAVYDGAAWSTNPAQAQTYDGSTYARGTWYFSVTRATGYTYNAFKTGAGTATSCTAQQEYPGNPLSRLRPGGSSGSSGPARVATDSHDLLVYYDYPGGSTWSSTGAQSLDLTVTSSSGPYTSLGIFDSRAFQPWPPMSGATGGVAKSTGTTTIGEADLFTAHAWVYMRAVPTDATAFPLAGKNDAVMPGVPYVSWWIIALQAMDATKADVSFQYWSGGSATSITIAGGLSPGLHHVAFTAGFGGSGYARAYIDGVKVGESAISAAITRFSHGPYFFGGFPDASRSSVDLSDIRIADTERSASYLAALWAARPQMAGASYAVTLAQARAVPPPRMYSGQTLTWAKAQTAAVRQETWATGIAVQWMMDHWVRRSAIPLLDGLRWNVPPGAEPVDGWVLA